jgi:EAL domain-containing protein (putative c-di-GMP-specific phosphodiesterase class I)
MTSTAKIQEQSSQRPEGELEAIAQRILATLAGVRVWSLSLHDEHADVLWLTESVMGPDEHEAVRASLEVFAGDGAPLRHEHDLGDGRVAVIFRAGHGNGSVVGVVMIIVDHKAALGPLLAVAAARSGALHGPLEEFAKWLSDDVSATQLRLRALSDLLTSSGEAGSPELELVADPEPAAAHEDIGPVTGAAKLPAGGASQPVAPPSAAGGKAPVAAPSAPSAARGPAAPAAPAGSAARPVAPAAPVPAGSDAAASPALDKHFAALRAQPIVLYAQRLEPMVSGSRIRRFEILLRTGSQHGRDKAPTAMLEAAAKHGLGSVLDRRVVTDLVVWLSRNPDAWRTDPIAVSVNLSPTALIDPHFFKFLEMCLGKADLPRGMIAFELDATLCARNLTRTEEVSQLLAALGCTLVLDDFALREGHIDLLGLKGLRMLKLHPDVTADIGADKRRQAVVAGIAQMACVLGMHTCAKAIESKQDGRWLAALKVDFAQGYGYAKPEPLAALTEAR